MIKRTPEQWQSLFSAHKTGGLSASAFCKEHNLCPKYFSLRRRQLGDVHPRVSHQKAFVKAVPSKPAQRTVTHEQIQLHGHFGVLSFPASISTSWLASFVKALS